MSEKEILMILTLYDPQGLISAGAPESEYEYEASEIYKIINKSISIRLKSPYTLGKNVRKVFDNSFVPLATDETVVEYIVKTICDISEYRHQQFLYKLNETGALAWTSNKK